MTEDTITVTETPPPGPETNSLDRKQIIRACEAELQEVLERHGCRIAPYWTGKQVGPNPGPEVLMVSSYYVALNTPLPGE